MALNTDTKTRPAASPVAGRPRAAPAARCHRAQAAALVGVTSATSTQLSDDWECGRCAFAEQRGVRPSAALAKKGQALDSEIQQDTQVTYTLIMQATFVELPPLERTRKDDMDDEAYRLLQLELMGNPKAGPVIEGTDGLRKPRQADPRRGKGKRSNNF